MDDQVFTAGALWNTLQQIQHAELEDGSGSSKRFLRIL
jgi:hypothetical protein